MHVVVAHPLSDWHTAADEHPTQVMGAFATLDDAKRAAVRLAVAGLDLHHFDPAKRFRSLNFGRWVDVWRMDEGSPCFSIETWAPGRARDQGGLVAVLVLNVDSAIKHYIDSRGMPSQLVRDTLRTWRTDPPALLLDGFVGPDRVAAQPPAYRPDRAAWEARFCSAVGGGSDSSE